jgi:holdfast attachment protein HfaA
MTDLKIVLIAAFAAACLPAGAEAGDWTNSANYNGFAAATQNTPSNFALRDANGNLTVVNGQFTGSNTSTSTGVQSANSFGSGVGMQGTQPMSGQATAIGNALNVVVVGNHNTTVVDSNQVNNGNQTATTQLGGH